MAVEQGGAGGQTRFARRGPARISYTVRGERGGRPVVVVLHDLLGDRSDFAGFDAGLGAAALVLAPDARGHGASAALAGRRFGLAELVEDVAAVLAAEGGGEVHLIGHGLGGATALALAGRYPGRVRSVVLVEPALAGLLEGDPRAEARWLAARRREGDRTAADLAEKGLSERALDAYFGPRLGDGWRARLPRARLAAARRHAAALAPLLRALEDAPVDAALGGAGVPVLLLRRASAPAIDQAVAERVRFLVPGTMVATVPDPAGDDGLLGGEAGRAIAAAAGAFIRGHDRGGGGEGTG